MKAHISLGKTSSISRQQHPSVFIHGDHFVPGVDGDPGRKETFGGCGKESERGPPLDQAVREGFLKEEAFRLMVRIRT